MRVTLPKYLQLLGAALLISSAPASAQNVDADAITKTAAYRDGAKFIEDAFEQSIIDTITLTEIPAPPFGENKRAMAFLAMLKETGFSDASQDKEGNVIALLPSGEKRGDVIVVSAHLDTVFPAGTDVRVKREGNRLTAPGVGDDSRNLAVILAYARALKNTGIQTQHDILFVGTVGEEGAGDLRGVRHLMTKGKYAGKVHAFLSFDDMEPKQIIASAVGSRRYRSVFKGPGGHSFSAFGIVNPVAALARTVDELYGLDVPNDPPTTYAASIVSGGTAVNSIPAKAELQVDLRSFDNKQLKRLDTEYRAGAARAVAQENARRSTEDGALSVEHALIGDRPAGGEGPAGDIAKLALAVYKAHGFTPRFEAASTDANIAMSLGIPALTVASGGRSSGIHTLDEFIELPREETIRGMKAGFALVLALSGER